MAHVQNIIITARGIEIASRSPATTSAEEERDNAARNVVATAVDSNDTYCSRCQSNILGILASKPYGRKTTIHLHRTLLELLHCRDECLLCEYICSLFEAPDRPGMLPPHWKQDKTQFVRIHYFWDEGRLPKSAAEHAEVDIEICLDGFYKTVDESRRLSVVTNKSPAFERPLWADPNPITFERRILVAQKWLAKCRTSHPKCRGTLPGDNHMGARIIQVDARNGQLSARLIPTKDLDLVKTGYIALSHCWGGVDIDCKTVRENIERYQTDGISGDMLPKTFWEALFIVLALDLRYIWIDSLCIIQDDKDDWESESAKMASIFRGATLTLSASSAQDCHGGCGLSKVFEPANRFEKTQMFPLDISFRQQYPWLKETDVRQSMSATPVSKRAWVFQETALSRRILHAMDGQFVWQCCTYIESEDGIHLRDDQQDPDWKILDTHDPEKLSASGIALEDLDSRWWALINDYMSRDLRIPFDKYAAFAGVTTLHSELRRQEPILSLWRHDLHRQLPWRASGCYPSQSPQAVTERGPRRPSWTWMSYWHEKSHVSKVRFTKPDAWTDRECIYAAKVEHIDIRWSGQPLTSTPSGRIFIRGICNQVAICDKEMCFDPNVRKTIPPGSEVHTLALFTSDYGMTTYLLLRLVVVAQCPAGSDVSSFERIGTMPSPSFSFRKCKPG